MTFKISDLVLRIILVYDKAPLPGWQDVRRTTHVHSLYWVHEGEGEFTMEGQRLDVRGGTLFYLQPGQELDMKSSLDHPLHMTMILFDAAAAELGSGGWRFAALPNLHYPPVQYFAGERHQETDSRVKTLRLAWAPGDDWREAAAQHQLVKLVHHLDLMRREETAGGKRSSGAGYEQAKAYMDRHYFADIRLQEVAKACGLSPKALRLRFLAETGLTPKEYMDQLRHNHAMRLLTHTDEPLKHIAAACGYYDEFHLSKSFKKYTGMSPSRYRKEQR